MEWSFIDGSWCFAVSCPANGQCEIRAPLASETNGGFVAKKGAAPVQLGAKFKVVKQANGTCKVHCMVKRCSCANYRHTVLGA
eukprot:COSAG02_NODE_412_length_22836_cov_41.209966_10_plen_83_part_00